MATTAFVIQPFNERFRAVYDLIAAAASKAGIKVFRADSIDVGTNISEAINKAISDSTFLIVDVSEANPNVMYELGFARSKDKPTILIANSALNVPFDLAGLRILIYDILAPKDFINRLAAVLTDATKEPLHFSWTKNIADSEKRQSVFISYSHIDKQYLYRLLVHMKPLERDGHIEVWVDTKLRAGDRWKKEIEKALGRATVAVLLVSADFLASEFIVANELPPILRKAEDKGTRIIPLVLKPCRYTRDKNLRHFQAINDPEKALILLTEGEQEKYYDLVAAEVEKYIQNGQ